MHCRQPGAQEFVSVGRGRVLLGRRTRHGQRGVGVEGRQMPVVRRARWAERYLRPASRRPVACELCLDSRSPKTEQGAGEKLAIGGEEFAVDHMFDVPLDLAQELTGFRHDRGVPGVEVNAYKVLENAKKRWGLF
jgi:hypothetical protein